MIWILSVTGALLAFIAACVRRKLLRRKIGDSPALTGGSVPLSPSTVTARAPPPMIRGWISKEGGAVRRAFNNRYFVLLSTATSSSLTYFLRRAPEAGPPYGVDKRGELDLRGGTFTQGTSHTTVTGKDGNRKKKYILDLKSSAERDKWVLALQRHVDYANHQQAVSNRVREGGGRGENVMFSFADVGV